MHTLETCHSVHVLKRKKILEKYIFIANVPETANSKPHMALETFLMETITTEHSGHQLCKSSFSKTHQTFDGDSPPHPPPPATNLPQDDTDLCHPEEDRWVVPFESLLCFNKLILTQLVSQECYCERASSFKRKHFPPPPCYCFPPMRLFTNSK